MSENTGSQQTVRLNSVDRCGRGIDPGTLNAAQAIAGRAIQYAETLIGCPALATSLLEEAAATVSRALRRRALLSKPPVLNLEAYLFRAFLRRVNDVRRKEVLLSHAKAVEAIASGNGSFVEDMDLKVLVDEILTRCDPVIKDMFHRRLAGFSWEEIGQFYGISAHAAESRFSAQLKRVRKRLGLE